MAVNRQSGAVAAAILGILLAFGMFFAARELKDAVRIWKQADRVVSVKGFSERHIKVDLVLLPITYTVHGTTLEELYENLERDEAKIRAFLLEAGFTEDELSTTAPEVTDQWASYYGDRLPDERYRANATVVVRTEQVDLAKEVMVNTDELVKQDVLIAQSWEHRPQFLFTKLDEVKPEMIAEATADARRAAEQFAVDSGSTIGKIRSAQQGYFTIEDLDRYTPDIKKVRVVTTIEYTLED
ncbi:MAG: SIMPL domain-containing protein [Firmicutes bacterium]|jgi:hypothetical protein|nr:SIMPL domain-containing protein [Bacillota bacterium]